MTPRELPAKATPVSPAEVYLALRLQLDAQLGAEQVTRAGAMILVGQMALETGRFRASMNYNLGGVKCGSNWSGCWQHFATTEHFSPATAAEYLAHVPEGAKVEHVGTDAKGLWILRFSGRHPMNRFRAYETLDVAMDSHVRFLLGKRYRAAVYLAMDGKAGDFARALRVAGYYTGDPDDYARNVSSLAKEYDRTLPADVAPTSPVVEPVSVAASLPPAEAHEPRHEPPTPPAAPPLATVSLPRVGEPLPVVALPLVAAPPAMAAQAVNVTVHELPGRIVAVYCGNCAGALRLALPMPLDELVEAGHAFRARHAACEPKDKPTGPF